MNSLEANIRNTNTKGELNSLRNNGNVPAIIYGGEAQNEKISISKKILKSLIQSENMSIGELFSFVFPAQIVLSKKRRIVELCTRKSTQTYNTDSPRPLFRKQGCLLHNDSKIDPQFGF